MILDIINICLPLHISIDGACIVIWDMTFSYERIESTDLNIFLCFIDVSLFLLVIKSHDMRISLLIIRIWIFDQQFVKKNSKVHFLNQYLSLTKQDQMYENMSVS